MADQGWKKAGSTHDENSWWVDTGDRPAVILYRLFDVRETAGVTPAKRKPCHTAVKTLRTFQLCGIDPGVISEK